MMTLPFGNVFREAKILLATFKYPFLGVILNLLIAEVAYARSNLPKTIIQMHQPMIHLYLTDSSSVQNGVSYISG
jgi:hypothetical protein